MSDLTDSERIDLVIETTMSLVNITAETGRAIGKITNKLVEKGVLTAEEANEIVEELVGAILLDMMRMQALDAERGT